MYTRTVCTLESVIAKITRKIQKKKTFFNRYRRNVLLSCDFCLLFFRSCADRYICCQLHVIFLHVRFFEKGSLSLEMNP